MKPRSAEASRLESDYLGRVRAALGSRQESEVEEIVQSLREHIEMELADHPGDAVGLAQIANILERLGPPEAYASDDDNGQAALPLQKADGGGSFSKLALASALCLPAAVLMATFAGILVSMNTSESENSIEAVVAVSALTSAAVLFVGLILGVAALQAIGKSPERLRGHSLAWIGVIQSLAIFSFTFVLAFLWFISSFGPSEPPLVEIVPPRQAE